MSKLALESGGHTCLLYEDFGQQKGVVLPFIYEGLKNSEHCLFLTRASLIDDWSLEFQAYGIDVVGEIEKGSLALATAEQWRERPNFNSIVKARELWSLMESKLADFAGVRIVGDADWAFLEPAVGSDQLCHWEATANLVYEGEPVRTICMYDLNRHPPADIRAALRTHATAVVSGMRYDNPFFEAPRILQNEPHMNNSDADESMVEDMLYRLRSGLGS